MPTLNEYADEEGYYILARPSETGNITYQLKPRGEQIVEKVGYQDGEEIGWQVISALKVPNLVYTGDEGKTDEDMSVDLNKEEIDALSEKDARQLLGELSSIPRVGDSQTDELEKILGISLVPDTEEVTDTIGVRLHERGVIDERVPEIISTVEDIGHANFLTISNESIEPYNPEGEDFEIHICGDLGNRFDKGAFISKIGISEDDGIVTYVTEINIDLNIEAIVEYQKLMADMLPIVVSELESMGIDTGPPESLPGLKVRSMH